MKKVHVIGICGVGMSATAVLLKEAGYEVSGVDAECYGPPADTLKNAGIVPRLGYDPQKLDPQIEEFVIGRNAKLSPEENEEVRAARETGLPVRSFPEVIGKLTEGRDTVVVAGSYGKSTTTALLAHILRHAGLDAGYLVGAEPLSLPAPARLGKDIFVVEGDEYPSAHDDARAKFMHLHANDVILTSVVHDHVNVYPTMEEYERPFRNLLATIPENGLVVVSAEEPNALRLVEESGKAQVTYGVDVGAYHATNIAYGEETRFALAYADDVIVELTTTLLGRHNVEDIVAASAYVLSRKLVSAEALSAAIRDFTGVRRRLDRVAPKSRIPTYEGFGSSYEKAKSAIAAIKLHFADRPLVVIFEPHTFGWRNRANLPWYDDVFSGAAQVFVAPPETQGAGTHAQLSHEEILERIQAAGIATHTYDPKDPTGSTTKLTGNEVVLILTSGDLEGSLATLTTSLESQFPL